MSGSVTGNVAEKRELPAGILTFVFTDIEESCEAWARRPDTMPMAMQVHNTLLVQANSAHDGIVLKSMGDGFCFVYSSVSDAIAMAIDAQAALQAAEWPDGERIKVRIGMHTGEAAPTLDEYYGETINRAARVMDAGNGDQITLSSASHAVLGSASASSSWTISALGEFELKGVGATPLFGVTAPTLLVDERPIRAKPVGTRSFPRNLQSFVGRGAVLSELSEAIDSHRLLTLVGVGGIGKSRLAIELAGAVQGSYADGAYWCPLAPVSDPEDVVPAIANIVGVTPRPGLTLSESLALALEHQQALVVIDNCEHVADAVSTLLSELLEKTNAPTFLATSRRALGLRGELAQPVEPLREGDDQVALFIDRVLERDPYYAPSAEDRFTIGQICEKLDGLPLAIELAAARARILSPGSILERLDDRFSLLGARAETNERLRDIVQWSYEQLGETEADLFRELSVFAGGFSVEAALAVCVTAGRDELDLIDALQTLVDDSLVRRDDETERFFMLETLRQFGTEELIERDEQADIRDRFITWLIKETTANAQLINTPREFAGFDGIDAERDNIREAFVVLTDQQRFAEAAELVGPLYYYGSLTVQFEVCEWARELAAHPELASHPLLANLCATASYGSYGQADTATSYELAMRGLEADGDNGPSHILAIMSSLATGKFGRTIAMLDELLPRLAAQPAHVQYWINAWRSLYDEWVANEGNALEWAEKAEAAAIQSGGTTVLAGANWSVGTALARHDPDAAIGHFRKALDTLGERAGRNLVAQTAQEGLVTLFATNGETDEAVEACRANVEWVLENDWLAFVFGISPTVEICIRAGCATAAAQLVGCAEANGTFVRGRAHKALLRIEPDLVEEQKAIGAGRSLRQALSCVADELREYERVRA